MIPFVSSDSKLYYLEPTNSEPSIHLYDGKFELIATITLIDGYGILESHSNIFSNDMLTLIERVINTCLDKKITLKSIKDSRVT